MPAQNEYIIPSTRWQALIGTLPFLAYGVSSMIQKLNHLSPTLSRDAEMAAYGLCLVGLLIGWILSFPLWSYGYLGWSILLAWFNTDISYYGVHWDYQVWIPFGITILVAILWTRSPGPIIKLFRDIWNDWTRLSLAMFAFGGFVWLIYDENHHPQLFWFMLAATLAISAGAWFFLRSPNLAGRVFSIMGGFVAGGVISQICYATWDYRAYYGLPESTSTWYQSLGLSIKIFTFWFAILFWPAIVGILHRVTNRQTANP